MPRRRTEPSGRIVLITGAASGIGLATARLAAEQGARLVLTDVAAEGLDAAVESIRRPDDAPSAGPPGAANQPGGGAGPGAANQPGGGAGPGAANQPGGGAGPGAANQPGGGAGPGAANQHNVVLYHEAFDISDAAAVQAFADRVHERVGPVDVVMNIAGISTWGRIQDLQPHHWRRTVEIDLMGPVHVMSAFVPAMIEAGRSGHVVNVSSAAGLFGLPLHAPYSAAKFGLRGVSEVLRFDLERHGIGVTLVCPGAVRTPLVGTVDIVGVDRDDPQVKKAIAGFEKHAVTPEHAAALILKGMRRGRYLVLTSADIKLGYLAQRYFPIGYTIAMRLLNRKAHQVLRRL
ncbi:SDR family oxidoreductase [Aeromicrobium sp. CTD01-1L150]|uniref:SDR family oxidoreductase n=1 Tax=Aeromicrobium sp. CTD01-1L150 TaxID=3341830 RepID=UPI0035C1E812